MEEAGILVPLKFGSITDRWGRERVSAITVLDWHKNEKESEALVEKCESMYQAFLKIEKEGKANGVQPE